VFNRKKHHQDKAKTLKIELSIDGQKWFLIHQGFNYWGDKIEFNVNSAISARYVKLSLEEVNYLHLSKLEVYSKSYLIIAGRGDGLGGRLQAFLNAIYISENTNIEFGFVWKNVLNSHAKDFSKNQVIGKNEIIGHAIESEDEIFTQDFISKYSYTDQLKQNQGILRNKTFNSMEQLITEEMENDWGWYSPLDNLKKIFKDINEKEYKSSMKGIWNRIGFSTKIKSLIKVADNSVKNFSSEFVAIHIRSGDIVYGNYRFIGKRFMRKALPSHLAIGAIEKLIKENKKIVLFGDDISTNQVIKEYFKKDVYLVNEFLDGDMTKLTNIEKAIFEITFMSNSIQIMASGASYFSSLASFIGNLDEVTSLYSYFSKEEQYEIIEKNISEFLFHPYQMAFSYFHLYILGIELKKDLDILEYYLKKAMNFDPDNNKYKIFFINILLENKKIQKAENMLKMILTKEISDKNFIVYKNFIDTLIIKADNVYWYSITFNNFIKYSENNPCLLYVSSKILKSKGDIILSEKFSKKSMQLFKHDNSLKNLYINLGKDND
jgi:hypothetical protein